MHVRSLTSRSRLVVGGGALGSGMGLSLSSRCFPEHLSLALSPQNHPLPLSLLDFHLFLGHDLPFLLF